MMSIIGNTVTNVKIMSLDPRTSPYVDLQVSLLYILTLNSTGSQWVSCQEWLSHRHRFPLQDTGSKMMVVIKPS